jgi:Beta-lactamase enzyme family
MEAPIASRFEMRRSAEVASSSIGVPGSDATPTTMRAWEIEEERELLARCEGSVERSRLRRGPPPAPRAAVRAGAIGGVAAALGLLTLALGAGFLERQREPLLRAAGTAALVQPGGDPRASGDRGGSAPAVIPRPAAVLEAKRYARGRDGLISFAVVDSRGQMHGRSADRPYVSASVVKALLLASELRRLENAGAPLDESTRTLLTQMITYSDNAAADAIYARVGDAGLYEVAERTGMHNFTVSGYWANAQITAGDIAHFMWKLDQAVPAGKREFGLSVLGQIVPEQSWGIPGAVVRNWKVRFKGGWRSTELGQLVHQAAELRHPDGSRMAVAVLTDAQPTQAYGIETVRGVADRLLEGSHPQTGSSRPSHSE